jgi:hypothetical protein
MPIGISVSVKLSVFVRPPTVKGMDDATAPLTVGGFRELMERHGVPDDAVLVGPPLGKGLGPSRLILSAISIKLPGESTVTLTQFAP